MTRFNGTIEKIGDGIDVRSMKEWVSSIPLTDWPQSRPPFTVHDAYTLVRPAIVNDPNWRGFGEQARNLLNDIRQKNFHALQAKKFYDFKISTIVPEQFLGTHRDEMAEDAKRWCFRVHVPIITNPHSFFILDKPYRLEAGSAYIVNVEHLHAVVNHGTTSRVHFLFEVDEI